MSNSFTKVPELDRSPTLTFGSRLAPSTTSFLNQIFYQHNKFDNPASISILDPWMLTVETKKRILLSDESPLTTLSEKVQNGEKTTTPSTHSTPSGSAAMNSGSLQLTGLSSSFAPEKEDTLFWCTYAVHHGHSDYLCIGNKYKNAEIQEKQLMIEFIKSNASAFKKCNYKISQVRVQEYMSELMINKKTTFQTFLVMCIYYKIHAFIVYENTFMDFSPILPSTELDRVYETYIFTRTQDGHFSVDLTPLTSEQLKHIRETKIQLERSEEKPLKAASNFKMSDLELMATKLNIVLPATMTKWKKDELYSEITKKCTW